MTSINAEYGTTADGLMAARIDHLGLIAIPSRGGRGFRVATALSGSKPICEWSASDGLGSDGQVADEAGFRAHVEECLLHLRQRDALGRATIYLPVSTPWGPSQSATRYAEGIVCHETASHGGFHLDAKRNGAMHPALRLPNGWYEEDGDWARVATAYPDIFTEREKRSAEKILRDWMPDAWEAVHGRQLGRSESFTRDRQGFARDHSADWIVISAARSPDYPEHVIGTATIGGRREIAPTRSFLISDSEYDAGGHGFVIDTARHKPLD